MNNLYENLSWLLPPPDNFFDLLTEIKDCQGIKELSKFALSENHLRSLSKKLNSLRTQQIDLSKLSKLSLGVISNGTTKLLSPALEGTSLRYNINLNVIEAEFNQLAQEAYTNQSNFENNEIDIILLAIDHRGLPIKSSIGNINAAENTVRNCLNYLESIIEGLHKKSGAQVILQNIAIPGEYLAGSYESILPGTPTWIISRINQEIAKLSSDKIYILDIAGLAANIGLANWHDPTLWDIAKLHFAPKLIPIYAEYVCRILAAKIGKSRRCLILDLDNTLWGGVIGDDGIDGIIIGNGNPTGEAFLNIQRIALEFRDRGIILAVSSKNEDSVARRVFQEHPDMLIKEEHIAVFQANWADKASNIKAIANKLSLGLESMVFFDDNPAERLQVRNELPDVAVLELPQDPALFRRTLIAAGYFESILFSEEDRKRANFYQNNTRRSLMLGQYSDINSYLKSLEMKMFVGPFNSYGRARIAQLINKSNQFNLTTKRYNENDVKNLEKNINYFTRQIRLEDSFGDNGMICVIICKKEKDYWEIDTWLMSCRVIGRRVEEAVLQDIIKIAMSSGISKLVGHYIPTNRNMIVKDHYLKLGFTKVGCNNDIEKWELIIDQYEYGDLPIQVRNF